MRRLPARLLTVAAVGFLALDGVLLLLAARWLGRVGLALFGGAVLLAAVAVGVLWRRQRHLLAGLTQDRGEVADAARALRDELRS